MISPQAAALAVQVAKGLVKLTRRMDLVLAEKEAAEAPLALPLPRLGLVPADSKMKGALREVLASTQGADPDPLAADRAAVLAAIAASDRPKLLEFVRVYAPKLLVDCELDLNQAFLDAVRKARPDWADDPDRLVSAFYVGAGRDRRSRDYTWRIALTVVDVVAEFGGENAGLFVRDPRLQAIVSGVLTRFGEADAQETETTRALLRAALGATLNGVLDARESLGAGHAWVEAGLDGLVQARDALPKARQADFLLGLFRGRGTPLLVSSLAEAAAGRIDNGEADNFRIVAATFLRKVATVVKAKEDFRGFFEDHWGDLLRAGLGAVEVNATALLGDEKLLGAILVQVAGDLAKSPDHRLLSTEALTGIVNSVARAAAANPDEVEARLGPNKRWLAKIIESVSGTVADEGIRAVFSSEGAQELFRDAFATFADHPDLIVGDGELPGALVGGVLEKLAAAPAYNARELAAAAVGGALAGVAANPDVVRFDYPDLVADLAGRVSDLVSEKKLSGVQGRDLLRATTEALVENPALLLSVEMRIGEVVAAVVDETAKDRPAGMVVGITVTNLVSEVVAVLARTGAAALANHPGGDLVTELGRVVDAGLVRAESEMGHRLGVSTLPAAIGLLTEAWATGKLATVDPENANFKKLFAELADGAAAGRTG
ncbi:MAG: hypothetical protein ABFS86_03060 [Planctomycetota bacterium]